MLFSILFLLPLPYQFINSFGEGYKYIITASYTVALLLTFIFFTIIFSFINSLNKRQNVSLSIKASLVIISVLLYLAISFSKVSFLFVLGSIYGYIFFRMKYYKNIYHIIAMSGFITIVGILYYLIINTETFLKNPYLVNSADISPLKYIIFILPSLIYILLKIYSMKIRSFYDFFDKIKTVEILDIEILILLIIILFPLPFQYFKGIQIYLAYILILSHMNLFINRVFSTNSH